MPGSPERGSSPAGPDAPPLRVASFNIRSSRSFDGLNSWPLRRPATAAAIRALDADVVGLQEVHPGPARYLRRALAGVAAVGAGRRDGRRGERCLILYRTERLRLVGWTTRWFSDEPLRPGTRLAGAGSPRVATLAELVARDSGERFAVANVHLDERREGNRVASARLLVSWLAPHVPWIVLGDFNAVPASGVLAVVEAAGFTTALDADAGGTAHDFTGRADGARIDHVLVGPQWDVLAGTVVRRRERGRLASDHWPVVADLRLRR